MTQSDGLPAVRRRSWDRRQNWPLGATFLLLLTLVSLLPGPGLVGHALSQPGAGQMPDVVLQPESNPYPWWNELNVLGHETPPPEMQNLVNGVVWGEWPQTKMLQEVIWRETARLHADGGRYFGCITMTGDRTEVFVEHPELNQARVIDIYGQPLEWGNGNHPLWQSFLLE